MNRQIRGLRVATSIISPREALADFLESLEGTDRKANTIIYYRSAIRQFAGWMEDEMLQLGDLVNRHIRRYFVYREEVAGVSRHTMYHDWVGVRKFLHFCRRQDWIDGDPMEDLRFRKPRPAPPDVPSADLVASLLQAILDRWNPKKNPAARKTHERYRIRICRRDYCLALALFETGARRGEIISLTPANLRDLDAPEPYLILQHTKTREDRIAFVSREWVEAYKSYVRVRPKNERATTIWHGEYGDSISAGWFTRKLAAYRAFAKIERITPQHLRRFRASRLVQNKTDLYAASEILGNSPEVLRRNYLEKNQGHLRERWQASMSEKAIVTSKTARRQREK